MDYEKAYKDAMARCEFTARTGLKFEPGYIFPELNEKDDEKAYKHIKHLIRLNTSGAEQSRLLAYLEKHKEHPMSAEEVLTKAGLKPFKDGNQWSILAGDNIQEGICGFGDTIEEALQQFLMEVREEQKKQKQSCWESPEVTHEMVANELKPLSTEETELNSVAFLEQMGYTCIPPGKEQKPIDCGVLDGGSDYDKGYRDGHRYGLQQTEDYMLRGGKTFKGLIPCWVNAPSTLQPAHRYHGKNAVIMHENNGGFRCCFIDDEKATTIHLPEDTFFVEGWRKKSVEWKPQPESLEALMYAIEGKWEKIKPTSYLSRRLEDLYEGLVNTYNVDEAFLAELPKTIYSAKDIEELKKLKDKIDASMESPENKPAEWSEEDEQYLLVCKNALNKYQCSDHWDANIISKWLENRLKSLRPQPQGTYKQVIHTIFGMLKDKDFYEIQPSHRVSLLNDIRVKCKDAIECAPILDEPHWKPTEEQMCLFEGLYNNYILDQKDYEVLKTLYDDLKKLM